MKKLKELLNKSWFANTFALCSAVVLFFILMHLGDIFNGIKSFLSIFTTIFWGLILAYFINPMVSFFENKIFKKIKREKVKRNLAILVSVSIIISSIVLLFIALIPSFIDSFENFLLNIDSYAITIRNYLQDFEKIFKLINIDVSKVNENITNVIQDTINTLPTKTATILNKSYNIGLSIGNIVISFIFAIYFLAGKDKMIQDLKKTSRFIKDDNQLEKMKKFLEKTDTILVKFIGFDILDGIIVGIVNAILMIIFNMPYVSLVSIIVGVTNLLPTFGPILGGFIGFIVILLNNPVQAFIFLIITFILQTIDGYIIKPKMFGNAFNVPAIWTLASLIIFGKLFGVLGILFAIPFAAVISFAYNEFIIPYLEERKNKGDKKEA